MVKIWPLLANYCTQDYVSFDEVLKGKESKKKVSNNSKRWL